MSAPRSCPTCATCHDTDAGFYGAYAASCAQVGKKTFDVCSGHYDKPARHGGFQARTMCCACGGGCSYGIRASGGCCCPAKGPNATSTGTDPGEPTELPPSGTAVIGVSVLLFLLLLLLLWWWCRKRRREKAREKAQTRIDAVALFQDGTAGKNKSSGASRRQLELLRLGSVNSVGSFHCNPSRSSSNNGSTRAPIKPWPSSAGGTGGGMYLDRKGGGLFKGGFAWTRSHVEVDAEAGKMTFYKAPSKNKTGAVLGAEGGAGGDSTFSTRGGAALKEVRVVRKYGCTYGGFSLTLAIPALNPALPASCPLVHVACTGSRRRL